MTAGVGLGHAFKMMLGITVVHGVNSGMDTYLNQAVGAKHYELAGQYFNRGRLITFLTFLPCLVILLNTQRILMLLGQNEKVAHYA